MANDAVLITRLEALMTHDSLDVMHDTMTNRCTRCFDAAANWGQILSLSVLDRIYRLSQFYVNVVL
jgi:hypothetical protein